MQHHQIESSLALRRPPFLHPQDVSAATAGRWVQVEHSADDFKWSFENCSSIEAAPADFIESLSFGEEDDFARPPVFFRQVSTEDGEYIVLVLHHALYDGLSLPMLFHHVRRLYRNDITPDSPATPFMRLADSILLQEHAGTEHWRKLLQGARPYVFPCRASVNDVDAWWGSLAGYSEGGRTQTLWEGTVSIRSVWARRRGRKY